MCTLNRAKRTNMSRPSDIGCNFYLTAEICVLIIFFFFFKEAEQAAKDREVRRQAHEERVAERAERARHVTQHPKSPSDFSCQSYDMFTGQDRGIGDDHHREKMSLRSASITSHDKHSDTASMGKHSGKTRKVRPSIVCYRS